MMGDELFPIPQPTFIFVHEVRVIPPGSIVMERDERGKVTENLPPLADLVANIQPVKGYLTNPDATRDQTGYIMREQITAVCLLPIDVNVDSAGLIMCFDPQLPPHLAGIYEIDVVRATLVHKRVLLRRFRLQFDKYGDVV